MMTFRVIKKMALMGLVSTASLLALTPSFARVPDNALSPLSIPQSSSIVSSPSITETNDSATEATAVVAGSCEATCKTGNCCNKSTPGSWTESKQGDVQTANLYPTGQRTAPPPPPPAEPVDGSIHPETPDSK